MTTSDYASTIGSHEDGRFNFRWPAMPFNRTSRDGITMNEDMRSAYGSDSASLHSVQGYLDEKKHNPNYPLPVLEPAPAQQASIRKSLASWFQRSGGKHPLKLNPMSRWSRSTTRQAGGGDGTVPPMPDLSLQRAYTGGTIMTDTTTGTPSNPAELASVYTPGDDIQVPYTSHWSASSLGSRADASASVGAHARASSTSSWTSGTRTTMQGEQERDSMATGLSPPTYYLGGSSAGSTVSELSAGTETFLSIKEPSHGKERLTNLHEELLGLYAQGESAAAAEQEPTQVAGKRNDDGPPRL